MKALKLKQLNIPLGLEESEGLIAGPGEVIVQLKAAALNRRDFWITRGLYPNISLPVVLGSDGAGIVSSIGEGVDQYWLDQKVILNPGLGWGADQSAQSPEFQILGLPRNGTFASEVSIPEDQLFPLPSHLSWEEAAALPLAGVTAYRALFSQGRLQAGENVLITGIGGGVATLALQFAVAANAKVWVSSSSPEKIELAIQNGAIGGFDYRSEESWKSYFEQAKQPDLIIDGAAGKSYSHLINFAAPAGRIVNYGATNGPPEKVDMFQVFWKQLTLQGSTMGSRLDFERMLEFVIAHQIRPVIDRVFNLEEGSEAIQLMDTSPQFGKYVLRIKKD